MPHRTSSMADERRADGISESEHSMAFLESQKSKIRLVDPQGGRSLYIVDADAAVSLESLECTGSERTKTQACHYQGPGVAT